MQIIALGQFLMVPSLMIYFLDTVSEKSAPSSFMRICVRIWLALLTRSTPIFTLLEGFSSLLVIQAVGQFVRWIVNNCSDSWMVDLLIFWKKNRLSIHRSFFFLGLGGFSLHLFIFFIKFIHHSL